MVHPSPTEATPRSTGYDGRILRGGQQLLQQRRVDLVVFECCHLWKNARVTFDEWGADGTAGTVGTDPSRKSTMGSQMVKGLRRPTQVHSLGLVSLARAAPRLGYALFLIGERNLLQLAPAPYTDEELLRFEHCGWRAAQSQTPCAPAPAELVTYTLAAPHSRLDPVAVAQL